jgi:hypothetical protein
LIFGQKISLFRTPLKSKLHNLTDVTGYCAMDDKFYSVKAFFRSIIR